MNGGDTVCRGYFLEKYYSKLLLLTFGIGQKVL